MSDAVKAAGGPVSGHFKTLDDGTAIAVVEREGQSLLALHGTPNAAFSDRDHQFLRKLVAVFNADLASTGDLRHHRETWTSLSSTRYARAIARVSAFSTSPFIEWLSAFEAATRQTYEGERFSGYVLFAKQLKAVKSRAADKFIAIPGGLGFGTALLTEKWVKPLLSDGTNALVAVGHTARVLGIVDCELGVRQSSVLAPHDRLDGLYQYLAPGTTTLVASKAGDVYLSLPSGMTFAMSQGRWRYENHDGLLGALEALLDARVARSVVRLALNARFDRRGALFAFLDDEADIDRAVPDHSSPGRVAGVLRGMIGGHSIDDAASQRMLSSVAAADGAIVLTNAGRVIDGACMISEPSADSLRRREIPALQRFAGARTTAAWNASVYGTAIKVSEDGPIEVYNAGSLVFRIG